MGNKFPSFFYRTSTIYVGKFIASKRTNMSNMLNVFHFAIFHIIIHGILKFNALTFILFSNERLINVSVVTFFTGMHWKFDVNTTADKSSVSISGFPKRKQCVIYIKRGMFPKGRLVRTRVFILIIFLRRY